MRFRSDAQRDGKAFAVIVVVVAHSIGHIYITYITYTAVAAAAAVGDADEKDDEKYTRTPLRCDGCGLLAHGRRLCDDRKCKRPLARLILAVHGICRHTTSWAVDRSGGEEALGPYRRHDDDDDDDDHHHHHHHR